MVTLLKRRKGDNKESNSEQKEKLKKAKAKQKSKNEKSKKQKSNNQEDNVVKPKKKFKLMSKRKKRKEKQLVMASGTMYAPSSGYTSTPSIIKSGNRYGTVFKVVNTYGMNRNQTLGWAVNLIPEINVEGVKGYLFTESKPFGQKEQSNYFKNIIPDTEKTYIVNDTGNVNSPSDEKRRKARLQDFEDASVLDGDRNIALDLRIHVLIVGDNPDDIQDQIHNLNKLYGKRISGIKLMSAAGNQEQLFQDLLVAKEGGDSNDYTIMSTLYAGFDHALRRGLNDKDGLPIGELSDSHTKGQAFMSLNNSFKSKILIASHKESQIRGFSERLSASSLWGQLVANNAMMYGHRTFHLVLNGHRYYGDIERSQFACPPSLNKHLQYVDLSKGGLNPIQTFGDENASEEEITNIFTNTKEKLTQIVYLASGRSLYEEKQDLIDMIEDFYINSKIWVPDYPKRSKIVGIKHPETVKTFGDFIRVLNNNKKSVRNEDNATEKDKNNAKSLHQTVESALNTYSKLFNTTTTLPNHKDENKLQWFYDVSNIANPDIREAQFINAFDYCTYTAAPNDIVMIHGVDKISVETMQLLKDNLDRLSDKGVRLAYAFDTIGSGEAKQDVPRADIFNTDGILYQDLEQQFDYTILGTMSKTELANYEYKVKQDLNQELESALMRDAAMQFLLRRPKDLTSNIVNPAEFII
ncbi:hypothetical protein BUY85_00885 [Staphylococcus equorum]|uniref:hypothetical protein n=1 Tax=Staphylococcus equorum TaxID=246432 RepID=UPI000D1C2A00|nr:hypothetical protein [Staphylococcus equorum]PTE82325.1 hypothetical protein BUY85_00885 [Staphylococcus equorum]